MKKLLILSLVMSFSALANECARPGTMMSRDYTGIEGETAYASHSRRGDDSIPTESSFSGNINARLFKVYREQHCVQRSENYTERVCDVISIDLALGRGNDLFKSLFDLRVTALKRSEMFAQNVVYGRGQNAQTRFNLANEIIKSITRIAAEDGIPNSWEGFRMMIGAVVAEGLITQADMDDITIANAESNKMRLGFKPLPGSEVREGRGNGKLQRIFNLEITPKVRAQMVNDLLIGVAANDAQDLGQSFVNFAISNGVPQSWDQFVLMMRFSVDQKAITEKAFAKIVVTYEDRNRERMGFEQTAIVCKNVMRTRYFNVIETRRSTEYLKSVARNYNIVITKAPLLSGEEETITASFNGLDSVNVSATYSYNNYRTVDKRMVNEVEVIQLEGARKQVTPRFTLAGSITSNSTGTTLTLQDPAFNPKMGGKVVVKVEFMEKVPLWFDKSLGKATYELTDASAKVFKSTVKSKKGRKVYAKVSMQIVGSPYYNSTVLGTRDIE